MALSKEFVDILACPQCKRELKLLADGSGLVCHACRLKYRICDEIPVMLVEEAEKIGD